MLSKNVFMSEKGVLASVNTMTRGEEGVGTRLEACITVATTRGNDVDGVRLLRYN